MSSKNAKQIIIDAIKGHLGFLINILARNSLHKFDCSDSRARQKPIPNQEKAYNDCTYKVEDQNESHEHVVLLVVMVMLKGKTGYEHVWKAEGQVETKV